MTTAQQFLDVARTQIGYREGANNSTKFGKWFGMDNVAWCAIFMSWCADQSGCLNTIIPRHSYTPTGYQWFVDRGQSGHTPHVGDIAYFRFPGISRISHVGVVEAVLSGGRIQTIEGNTDAQGSRTGGGVWRKIRATSLVAGYGYPKWGSASNPQSQEDDVLKDQTVTNPVSGKSETLDVTVAYLEQRIVDSLKKQLPSLVADAVLNANVVSGIDQKPYPVRQVLSWIDRATNLVAKKQGV